ncbi:MAG TPA: response regulator transcription factor [Anaerolineae bacterium]|nr:response regulator transcription factor [Anaerolineae bacterium]
MINILLVDDDPAVRRGLRMRLAAEPDLNLVGEAADGLTAIALAEALRPDVALIDVELPLMDGIAVAERLRGLCPRPAVIMLTLRDDADTRERACAAGVSAFVAKRGIPDELIAAIRQAVRPPAAAPPMDRTEL